MGGQADSRSGLVMVATTVLRTRKKMVERLFSTRSGVIV
jgi:hypothetical protein